MQQRRTYMLMTRHRFGYSRYTTVYELQHSGEQSDTTERGLGELSTRGGPGDPAFRGDVGALELTWVAAPTIHRLLAGNVHWGPLGRGFNRNFLTYVCIVEEWPECEAQPSYTR